MSFFQRKQAKMCALIWLIQPARRCMQYSANSSTPYDYFVDLIMPKAFDLRSQAQGPLHSACVYACMHYGHCIIASSHHTCSQAKASVCLPFCTTKTSEPFLRSADEGETAKQKLERKQLQTITLHLCALKDIQYHGPSSCCFTYSDGSHPSFHFCHFLWTLW